MAKSTISHYFYGHVQSQTVGLPECSAIIDSLINEQDTLIHKRGKHSLVGCLNPSEKYESQLG